MTLKTSLFNKGVYKSTVKRYMWGSVLYFVILFMITVLPIVFSVDLDDTLSYIPEGNISLLYSSGFMIFSSIVSMFVPTITGLLVFRFVHSKKASVFTHSLPVNRTSMYISTIAASFTLMLVPIILNGLILILITATIYYNFISISSCLVWIAVNMATILLMFSCVCFVSMLTGNSFAMVGLNVLLHAVVPVTAIVLNVVACSFLYGMGDNLTQLVIEISKSNYVYKISEFAESVGRAFYRETEIITPLNGALYVACAILFYIAGWILYKKRNLENAEDVAGFKCLNPIFKYLVTFFGTLCVFALFSSVIANNPVLFLAIIFALSCIIYFASEMILKKTLKVFKSYKGYIGFAVAFSLMICIFAFTSFFGYETYVPKADEVEEVAIYSFYNNIEPYVDDKQVAEYVTKIHNSFLAEDRMYIAKPDKRGPSTYTRMHIKYKMQDGDVTERVYYVSEDEYYELMNKLYGFNSYKYAVEMPMYNNMESLYKVNFFGTETAGGISLKDRNEMENFVESLKKDVEELSYDRLHVANHYGGNSVCIEWIYEGQGSYIQGNGIEEVHLTSNNFVLTTNFRHSREWLEQNGYGDYISFESGYPYHIMYNMEDKYYYSGEEFEGLSTLLTEPVLSKDKHVRVEDTKVKEKIVQYFENNYYTYYPNTDYFYVITPKENGGHAIIGLIEEDKAQEFMEYIFN